MKARNSERSNRCGVALAMGSFESLGFAFREQTNSDYGIDGHAELIESGQPTGRLLGIQIKSGHSYFSERTATDIVFRTDASHVDYWINHALPVIVCLCNLDTGTIYWQVVNEETTIATGKGCRLNIPITQILHVDSIPRLKDLLTPLVSSDRYTIFRTEDVSHELAKRYEFKVVVNGAASKAEIASIVRQVTAKNKKCRYHRNQHVEASWSDTDAHIVRTFVYLCAEDEARYNHVCRSLWISPTLGDTARPLPLKGENIGGDICVDWNCNYGMVAELSSAHTLNKEAYMNVVTPLIDELKRLLLVVAKWLRSMEAGDITEDAFPDSTRDARKRIEEIYVSTSDMPLAPFECEAVDHCCQILN